MRKHILTDLDYVAIGSLRSRCNAHLFTRWKMDPANQYRDVRIGMELSVPNDRELYAILEHVRFTHVDKYHILMGEPSRFVSFEEVTLHLALGRHGQPRPLLKGDMQPDFFELPRV